MQEKLSIITDILGTFQRSSSEYLFKCPYCKDNKHKFSVNIEKNVYKCWLCDARGRNLGRLVKRFGTFAAEESWKEISGDRLDLNEFDSMFEEDAKEAPHEKIIEMPESFKTLTSNKLDRSAEKAMNYLLSRGVNRSDILRWKIGYCTKGKYKNRIVIPSFNASGDLNYFIARSHIDGYIRYMNPPAPKDIIFNELYVDFEKEVVLVEGLFDAINTENSIPILGSSIREGSRLFRKIVKKDTPILLALDPDAKGKSRAIKRLLLKYGIEVREVKYVDERDIGEMSKEEVVKLSINAPVVGDYDNLLSAIIAV